MQEIIYRQHDAAKPLNGKSFLLSIAGVLLRLAIAQMLCNLLISLTGVGLINVAFYLFAVWLLIDFMRGTVAGYVYTLKEGMLFLERKLGDSTITLVEIPLDRVVSMRRVHRAENLRTTYKQVTHIDPASRPPFCVRAAFVVSLFSCRLARLLAGKNPDAVIGHVLVYDEGGMRRACTFCPDEQLQHALGDMLGDRNGFDERMTHTRVHTLYGRALERAFPSLYPFVDPLVKPEDVDWAREEIARQKAERQQKNRPAGKESTQTKEAAAQSGDQPPRRRRKQG